MLRAIIFARTFWHNFSESAAAGEPGRHYYYSELSQLLAKKRARSLAQNNGTTVAATGRAVISKPFGLAAALRARARFTLNLINKSANGLPR